jgi:hypothetical protein
MNRRKVILLGVLLALLIVTAAWSLSTMIESRDGAQAATLDLKECQRLAGRITLLGQQPTLASDRERQGAEINGPVEKAAQAAGIPADRLIRIVPEPAQRIGDGAYKEKPTRVFLKNVAPRSIATMVQKLTEGDGGLTLSSMRLTAPSRDATENLWTAELVFTYLVYEPLSNKS